RPEVVMAADFKPSESETLRFLSFLPHKLRRILMPFQQEGIRYAIEKNGRCLIADEMGLGKTLQALSVARYYKHDWPLLIVVPSSLKYPWIDEIEKWMPDVQPHEINLVHSSVDVNEISEAKITVVTYGLLQRPKSILLEALMTQKFKVVILDESHYIKNSKSIRAKCIVPIVKQAERRLLLSGTPALNRPEELYS
ncbi:unnamed protein product, partial [Owenia fusiformis]